MSSPTIPPAALHRLDRAAALLAGVARSDAARIDPAAALLCLSAAERLRTLGVDPVPMSVPASGAAHAVTEALTRLADLPEAVFASTPVLDAASDARTARELMA